MSETSGGASSCPAKEPVRPVSSAEALLQQARVASPCHVSWDNMPGGDRVRSCAHCQRKVYNLSEMTAVDAADLIRKTEGHLCVRFYRRADGSIMTRDCPTGLRAVRARAARGISAAFGAFALACGFGISQKPRSEYPFLLRLLANKIAPVAEPPVPVDEPTPASPGVRILPMAVPVDPAPTMGKIAVAQSPAPDPTDYYKKEWKYVGSPKEADTAVMGLYPSPDPTETPAKGEGPTTSFEDGNGPVINAQDKSFLGTAEVQEPVSRTDPFVKYPVKHGRLSRSSAPAENKK